MTPRVGWVPSVASRRVASVRLRCLAPAAALARGGFTSEAYKASRTYDVVVFQKAYSEDHLSLAGRLRRKGTKVVFDMCDNHLYNPTGDAKLVERAERLRRMLDLADRVTVSSEALAEVLQDWHPVVVQDAVERYPQPSFVRLLRTSRRPRLLWFGNAGSDAPPFGLVDLRAVVPELNRLHVERPFTLHVVSNSRTAFRAAISGARFSASYHEFSRTRLGWQLALSDVVVLPLTMNRFTSCKTANRVISSLVAGRPVVTTPIRSYQEFSPWVLFENWASNVARYLDDTDLAAAHVGGAQRHIAEHHNDATLAGQWQAVVDGVLA